MQTLPKTLVGLFIFLIFTCCSKLKHTTEIKIQGDTLKVITKTIGDTVFKQYIRLDNKTDENRIDTSIYSIKNIDNTITQSNFYFTAQDYKIYFDKQKVIAYCDSVIQNTPPDKEDEGHINWSIIDDMKELKKAAQSDKEMEIVRASWLSTLLERFNPLIINAKTNQKSKFLLKEKFLSRYEGRRNYSSINQQGDTSFIWYEQDFMEFQDVNQ